MTAVLFHCDSDPVGCSCRCLGRTALPFAASMSFTSTPRTDGAVLDFFSHLVSHVYITCSPHSCRCLQSWRNVHKRLRTRLRLFVGFLVSTVFSALGSLRLSRSALTSFSPPCTSKPLFSRASSRTATACTLARCIRTSTPSLASTGQGNRIF